jgi:hypothetical protein
VSYAALEAMGFLGQPDPALRGLEGRRPGSSCTTPCHHGCEVTCHERHKPEAIRGHDQYYCDQIRIGRDVTEYRPDIRQEWDAEKRAARMQAEPRQMLGALGRAGSADGLFSGAFGPVRRRDRLAMRIMRILRRFRG